MSSKQTVSVDMFTIELGYIRLEGYLMEDDKTVECIKLQILQLVHTQGKEIVMTRDVDYDILTDECMNYFEGLAYKEYVSRSEEQDD